MTPYNALRAAVARRGGWCGPLDVKRELDAYFALSNKRRIQGEGPLLVIETTAKMSRMTRSDYSDMVHKRKHPRRKRNKDGELVMQYEAHSGTVEAAVTGAPKHVVTDERWQDDLDWIDRYAAEVESCGYYGEF